ncbi:uncharacterized protein LOC111266485 [Varroa jacobsoni]|uniref:uncharacterized protein LOC111266485 n=1 Tax=Varroa jacobsoni TaxID=62625 RepID=UPI000BF7DAA7|nr:uncharacterized protein LOC111266485 [Varroa jacobsoni]
MQKPQGGRGGQGAGVGVSFDGAVGAFGSWLLLLTIGSFTEASKYQAPSFHEEPPSRVRFLNSSGVVIPCAVQGQPPPRITWIHRDGSEAPTVPNLRHVRSDGALVLEPFAAQDFRSDVHDTAYRCSGQNLAGAVLSRDVKVTAVPTLTFLWRFCRSQPSTVQRYFTEPVLGPKYLIPVRLSFRLTLLSKQQRAVAPEASWRGQAKLIPGDQASSCWTLKYNLVEQTPKTVKSKKVANGRQQYMRRLCRDLRGDTDKHTGMPKVKA